MGTEPVNLAAWLLERGSDGTVALLGDGGSLGFGALQRRARQIAWLIDREVPPGGSGERIVPILGANSVALAAAHLGVLHAGAVSAPLPPMTDHALAAVLRDTGARLVLADAGHVDRVQRVSAARAVPLDAQPEGELDEPSPVDPDAMALLLYTSGSTGAPRGVMLSAANVMANVRGILQAIPLGAADRALLAMPLHYCYALSMLHAHLRAGASAALVAELYPQELLRALHIHSATGLPAVPTMLQLLVSRSAIADQPPPALRYIMSSGGKPSKELVAQLEQLLPGRQIYLRYGVTELTAAVCCLPPERLHDKLGSIGLPLPGTTLEVLRDGHPVAPGSGDIGEIVASGECVALGYFHDPDETSRRFCAGRFFTGDTASVDRDGFLFLAGREREFIKTAGHRIAPEEVEDVIARLPQVADVGVCGVPDPLLGEAPVAMVVLHDNASLTERELRRHCALLLPAARVPIAVRFARALPRTSSGKLSRAALRALWGDASGAMSAGSMSRR